MSLKARLKQMIAESGPMNVADYVAHCLLDAHDGYYTCHAQLGSTGDFITAPMVSQMFGELLGAWVVEAWRNLGQPSSFQWVEIGGGDASLMCDMLRVASRVPEFMSACDIVMIEPSDRMSALQANRLKGQRFRHAPDLSFLDQKKPSIIVANEVLDCLGARQFIKHNDEWFEQCIGVSNDAAQKLGFTLVKATGDITLPSNAVEGQVYEISPAQIGLINSVCECLSKTGGQFKTGGQSKTGGQFKTGGMALFIDYGRQWPEAGDSLQALYRHEKHDPLEAPGLHDLTMWADFPSLVEAIRNKGLKVSEITHQGAFLLRLGILQRLEALILANPEKSSTLQNQVHRLIAPKEMGQLFKLIGFCSPHDLILPALET